jgi:4-amino-4-deoxy-L-arabinose transferase-like glycosyltransferase
MKEITPRRLFVVILFLILLVATGLRLYRLPELPLGLHYDEAANGILAGEIARGIKTPIFIPSYTGKEVLFFYWTALWIKLLGVTPLALRLSAALAGVATVAATVWAIREMLHGRRDADWVALLAGAFLATSFWHLILSRYGFRAVTQPLMQALTVAALWRGLRLTPPPTRGELHFTPPPDRGGQGGGRLVWLLLAGLFCGLAAYTYLAARAFPIPLAAALLTLLVTDRGRRRLRLGQLALFVAVAALTLAPLAHYWLAHPGSFLNRTQQVAAASWAEAWAGIRACLGMFFLRGDPGIRFNLPRRPLFDPVTAALFLLGIVVLFKSQITGRKSSSDPLHLASCVFFLTLLPIMLLPSALAPDGIPPSNLRTVGLLPFIYVFPALALSSLKSRISVLRPSSLVILVLILSGFFTASIYFDQWAVSAELYYAADGDLADAATYLDRADLTATTPYVASIHYRHPTLAFLSENYEAIRWLTGGQTVVFPAGGDALLIFPRSASEDRAWAQSVLPDESLVAAPAGPDGAPAFHVYRANSTPDLMPIHPLTADLAHIALVLGYDVVGEPRSGESAEVAVWWRVLNVPDQGDYGPVARLTDRWGFDWGVTQPFHYPSEQWTPGEAIVDHLSIPVAPGAPPGDYRVHCSLYSTSADASLRVLDHAGRYAGTGIELPLRLERAAAPPDPDGLDIRTRLDARAGGLTLLGANLDAPTDAVRPGERLYLTLFWRADETPLPDYDVHLSLSETTLYAGAPVHGTYPTSVWIAGEVVADRYDPRLPLDTPPGDHPLRLQLGDLALDLGNITVETTERTFEVPPISHPLTATLGDQVELLGYALSAETITMGDTLILTLYWRALTEMDENYTVFAHLLAPDGSMTGQRDSYPVGGAYPTTLWVAGEVVADVYEIPIRADAAPGMHRLEVGMYVAETGARLPIAGISDDAIVLRKVTVAGP